MNYKIDLRGLDCPVPLIKTKKELEKLQVGDVLEVTSNTPLFYDDVVLLCKKTGDRLLSRSHIGPTTAIIKIEKQ